MSNKHILKIHPHVMGDQHHDRQQGNRSNVHSFSATYSNVNGHVQRHFSRNGHSVNSRSVQKMMKQMDHEMNRSFKQMNRAFGDLDHLTSSHDSHRHSLKHLIGRWHRNDRGNLTNRIKHRH